MERPLWAETPPPELGELRSGSASALRRRRGENDGGARGREPALHRCYRKLHRGVWTRSRFCRGSPDSVVKATRLTETAHLAEQSHPELVESAKDGRHPRVVFATIAQIWLTSNSIGQIAKGLPEAQMWPQSPRFGRSRRYLAELFLEFPRLCVCSMVVCDRSSSLVGRR